MKAASSYHILTLVVQKDRDIPRIRSKVKLLVKAIGGLVEQVTGVAVGASECARLLLQRYGGGEVRIALLPVGQDPAAGCGVELFFHGNTGCLQGEVCPLDKEALLASAPFPGLIRVFAEVRVEGGIRGMPLTVHCWSRDLGVAWDDIYGHLSGIRGELFADTEESYMENLRAKHDEVTRLLREKTEQNKLLDESNNELLLLSNDLEEMARERAIIEMSLRIADQVRNPATVIGGMARRLLDKGDFEEQEQRKIHLISEQADKIDKIVKQFNAMAAQRKTIFNREDIGALLHDALQACPTLHRKQIRVQLKTPEKAIEIHANRQLLKIALVHILRYFTRQSREGDELTITVAENDGTVVRFFSETAERKVATALDFSGGDGDNYNYETSKNGTGLGLVRQIMAEHQAELISDVSEGSREVIIHFPLVFQEHGMDGAKE